MTINFLINDILSVRPTVLATLQTTYPQSPAIEAKICALNLCANTSSKVLETGHTSSLSFIRMVPLLNIGTSSGVGYPDPSSAAYNNGRGIIIYFNSDEELNNTFFKADGASTLIGPRTTEVCKNVSGLFLQRGYAVRVVGEDAVTGMSKIDVAVVDHDDPHKADVLGIIGASSAPNTNANVILYGLVRGIDTTGAKVGNGLYLSSVPGLLSITPTDIVVALGFVIAVGRNGTFYVHFGEQNTV